MQIVTHMLILWVTYRVCDSWLILYTGFMGCHEEGPWLIHTQLMIDMLNSWLTYRVRGWWHIYIQTPWALDAAEKDRELYKLSSWFICSVCGFHTEFVTDDTYIQALWALDAAGKEPVLRLSSVGTDVCRINLYVQICNVICVCTYIYIYIYIYTYLYTYM